MEKNLHCIRNFACKLSNRQTLYSVSYFKIHFMIAYSRKIIHAEKYEMIGVHGILNFYPFSTLANREANYGPSVEPEV